MDCAEEVAILKRELGPLVGGEENLSFNILHRKMTVRAEGQGVTMEAVMEVAARAGMTAIPWPDAAKEPSEGGFWQRRGRTVVSWASGALLLGAFALHAALSGFREALAGGGQFGQSVPLAVLVLYLGSVVTGAWFVIPKAILATRRLRPDMNLLMAVAITGAIGLGEWFEAATVSFLFALALLLESWSAGRARRAITALMDLSPTAARYICPHDGEIEEQPVSAVPVGVTVLVRPGEKVPLDGVVTEGATSVNEAPITGESAPVAKQAGDEIFAGTINNEGAFQFRVTRPADDTTLARIIHMVEEAQHRRAPTEQWVEKFARYYTPAMMLVAVIIAVGFPLIRGGEWREWFYEALVVLVIACPCALVISTPVSIVAGLSSAARAGVLIKGGIFLEAPARLRVIALDKTGTLTAGRPEVQEVVPFDQHTPEELLERAAALEAHSEHHLAGAILRHAKAQGIDFKPAERFRIIQGKGAEAEFGGRPFWIGSHRFMHERAEETLEFCQRATEMEDAGRSVVALGNDDHVCGLIGLSDGVRREARAAVRDLKASGIERIVMLTGDHEVTAKAVAAETGVDAFHADLLPEEKVKVIRSLRQEFGQVAMVGDGVNDAPALAAATVGIAMAAVGTDAAIETADIALMSDDLSKLPWLIQHSRRTLRTIKQNVCLALGIKLAVIAMVLGGVAVLWMAIAADMGASLLVIFNSLRLLKGEPRHVCSFAGQQ
jgi:Cd2+/Zn2+-exporting ATPase